MYLSSNVFISDCGQHRNTHINISNTIHSHYNIQRTRSSKRQKVCIEVNWNRDDINTIIQHYESLYGIKANTKNLGKAPALQHHYEPFRKLQHNEICRCLDEMGLNRTKQEFSMSFERYNCNDSNDSDSVSSEQYVGIHARCTRLHRLFSKALDSLREKTEVIAESKRTISRLQHEFAEYRERVKSEKKQIAKHEAMVQSLKMKLKAQALELQASRKENEKHSAQNRNLLGQVQSMRKELSMSPTI